MVWKLRSGAGGLGGGLLLHSRAQAVPLDAFPLCLTLLVTGNGHVKG